MLLLHRPTYLCVEDLQVWNLWRDPANMLRVWHSKSARDLLHILPKAYLQRDHGHFFQFLGRKNPTKSDLCQPQSYLGYYTWVLLIWPRHIPNFRDCKEVFSLSVRQERGLFVVVCFFFWLGCWVLVSFCQTGGCIAKTPWPFAAPNTHIYNTGDRTRTALLIGAVILITPAAISHECFNSWRSKWKDSTHSQCCH